MHHKLAMASNVPFSIGFDHEIQCIPSLAPKASFSMGFDEGGVSKAGTPVSRKQSLVRKHSTLGFGSLPFVSV